MNGAETSLAAETSDLINGLYPFPKEVLNVLVVTEGHIGIHPSPEVFFSVGRVVEFLRQTKALPFEVQVDMATRRT